MTTVEEFFDDMCKEFLNKSMISYINMVSFRTDFIDQTYKSIQFARNTFIKNNVSRINDLSIEAYYEYIENTPKVTFWFNSTEKSNRKVDGYYYCFNKFIEIMANKR